MIAWFRRQRPVFQSPAPCREDMETAYLWCLTLDQWEALTDFERAECRRNVTVAPRFEAAS